MCGEVKSKQDEKTASTPLVTVSDLQRMKQFEVIILRMRKQPFKTKFTPYFKLNWGVKYPAAKYPNRKKQSVHTFDIKEYVKTEKKKKLLEMMNAADQEDRENALSGRTSRNSIADQLPPELQQIREKNKDVEIPDFLKREKTEEKTRSGKTTSRGMAPDFESFKREVQGEDLFNPFEATIKPTQKPVVSDDDDDDDDIGFDVDELVKKIDAKIAELEAEEKKAKETKDKEETPKVEAPKEEEKTNSINELTNKEENKPAIPTINLDEESEEDDNFFDDFFDN